MKFKFKMLRRVLNRKELLLCGILPNLEEYDLEEFKKRQGIYISDPWERVKIIFKKDDHGGLHPNLVTAIDMAQFGLLIGMGIGGFPESIESMKRFVDGNDTKLFHKKVQAQRLLANHSLLGFLRGGFRTAPKYGCFLGGIALFTSCVQAYRNKSGIIEYSFSGLVVGALFKAGFGLRGMFSGGVVGLTLGTIYGAITWSVLRLAGRDQLEVKFAQYALADYRKKMTRPRASDENEESLEKDIEEHTKNPLKNSDI